MFFDDNSISIDGSTDLSTSDDIKKRFESYNWNILKLMVIILKKLINAIIQAKKSKAPTIIACKTKLVLVLQINLVKLHHMDRHLVMMK